MLKKRYKEERNKEKFTIERLCHLQIVEGDIVHVRMWGSILPFEKCFSNWFCVSMDIEETESMLLSQMHINFHDFFKRREAEMYIWYKSNYHTKCKTI